VKYATSVVAPSKLIIGLPAYGYDWDLTASDGGPNAYVGTSVDWTGFAAIVGTSDAQAHWDSTSQSPYVDYVTTNGHDHEMWYENAKSLQAKTALVTSYHLAGVSMWALGDEDASFWSAVAAGL
jgi:spore germination protein YaaH